MENLGILLAAFTHVPLEFLDGSAPSLAISTEILPTPYAVDGSIVFTCYIPALAAFGAARPANILFTTDPAFGMGAAYTNFNFTTFAEYHRDLSMTGPSRQPTSTTVFMFTLPDSVQVVPDELLDINRQSPNTATNRGRHRDFNTQQLILKEMDCFTFGKILNPAGILPRQTRVTVHTKSNLWSSQSKAANG